VPLRDDMPSETTALRLVIAGGGTGGHVLPAVAVVEELRRRKVSVELLWIGSTGGVEKALAEENQIPFVAIPTGKLRRYLSIQNIADAARIPVGIVSAWRHLRRFNPDVVYSTGGAVSVPTALAAARLAPILTHEQTAQIGLANRTVARVADVFAVGFEGTAELARATHKRVVFTGNPVRRSLLAGDATQGLSRYGFDPDVPLIYVTGGARGASPLNQRIAALLPDLLAACQVLHQVGPASANQDAETLKAERASWPPDVQKRYHVVEFVRDELPDVYAAASIVVGRAGAGTVSELAYLGLPSILIPLPGTWGDEQRKNARLLADAGGAIYLEQADAIPERLRDTIAALVSDPARRREMAAAAASVGRRDGVERLTDELLNLATDASGKPKQRSSP
jgi:UDP-N-acetylglucosamine--N-acetylmuramyl-(pentapeptide) pyrophosphoryl-undecaprenol N-acetylglucosamine transferase